MEELSLISLPPTPLASNNPKVVAMLPYFFPICSSPSLLPVTRPNVYVQSHRAWEFTSPLSVLLTRNKPWAPALPKEEMTQTQSYRPRGQPQNPAYHRSGIQVTTSEEQSPSFRTGSNSILQAHTMLHTSSHYLPQLQFLISYGTIWLMYLKSFLLLSIKDWDIAVVRLLYKEVDRKTIKSYSII